jgi:Zn-dependent protease
VAYVALLDINLFWALLNLLPVWPLDGGQICRELLQRFLPRNGTRYALMLSTGVAGLLGVHFLAAHYGYPLPVLKQVAPHGDAYLGLMFAILAIGSYQTMEQLGPARRYRNEEPTPWETRHDDWDR